MSFGEVSASCDLFSLSRVCVSFGGSKCYLWVWSNGVLAVTCSPLVECV